MRDSANPRASSTGHPEATRRQLCALACDLFQLAGEISFDGNRYTEAAHCYALAATAGREAQASDQWACALTRQAFVSMYDKQHAQAADILTAAARVARHGDGQLSTRHWVAAVHAQVSASLGNSSECDRALDTASSVLGLTGPVSPGGWLRFDGSRLAEERGTCYLATGQDAEAETALTAALSQAGSPRRRASILTDLAVLGVRQRDTAQFLDYATAAVDLAEQAGSPGYVGRKLHGLQAHLGPLLGDARIAQLNDRITRLPATT